ncbi:MAG: BamA/TamA family outer membrane protein [Bacteroidetes bacterium SB0662_bin_6]|nr:BamA/TamA family outer membrane protein [Bacteroidetes bacterium SB0668_bin_1]MYE04205.1 BamA/TamA family outer membrane protein [Bacteroidetes bacterium SB0662_bin_6]
MMASRTKALRRFGRITPRLTTTFTSRKNDPSPCGRLHRVLLRVVWFAVVLTIAGTAEAQDAERNTSFGARPGEADTDTLIVRRVAFEGNEFFGETALARRVRTKPNRRFAKIPGATWWLWMYRLGNSGILGERLSNSLMAGGEPPAALDMDVLQADLDRLRLLYRQEGFFEAEVAVRIDTVAAGKAGVIFQVTPGLPTYIRNVWYDGVDHLTPDQHARLVQDAVLRVEPVDQDRPLYLRARRQRYSETMLHSEVRRILTFLRDEGYPAVTRDSIRAVFFEAVPDSFDLRLEIGTGPRYRFGDVSFEIAGPEPEIAERSETLSLEASSDSVAGGTASFRFRNEKKLSPGLLVRTLRFTPGDWYSQEKVLATRRRLEGTGVFLFTDIFPQPSTGQFTGAVPTLSHRVDLRTRDRHQIGFEPSVFQRVDPFNNADKELATGVALTYENANLLGRGEAFRVRTSGSISTAFDDLSTLTARQAEIATSLTMPYLMRPFRGIDASLPLYDVRTRLTLSLLTARRDDFGLIIRARGNARYRLELRHTETLTSLLDVVDVSLSNPDTLRNFQDEILNDLLDPVSDPVQRARILEDYTVPQINTAIRYALRSTNVNPLRRDRGYSIEASAELGNTVPYLLDRFAYSPGNVEGYLPGLSFFASEGPSDQLLYRRYVRFASDFRLYHAVNPSSVVALKFIGGIAHPLGSTTGLVPFGQRFYTGGGTSVRGWDWRELGPGGAQFQSVQDAGEGTNILGGDIKLEAGVEMRGILFHFLGSDWIGAFFVDAGNVWFGSRNPGFGEDVSGKLDGRFRFDSFYRQIGVGSGVGFRLDWKYLIGRVDLAVKVYDPRRPDFGAFPDGLGERRWHFGLGHAF